jgi:hypothetical protein
MAEALIGARWKRMGSGAGDMFGGRDDVSVFFFSFYFIFVGWIFG